MKMSRVWAIMIRHLFSWPRDLEGLAEAFWWPSFDLLIWGLMSTFLQKQQGVAPVYLSVFISSIVLWMFVYRSQQEVGIMFLKEVWDRNFLNIMTTPVTIWEFLLASLGLGTIKLAVSASWMMILAFVLFKLNVFSIGWVMILFVINLLLTGWSAGFFINGLIVQYGNRIQSFAWTLLLIIQPFSAVFYPVSSLPGWMQWVAKILPTSYIFEGMRASLLQGKVGMSDLVIATALNMVYLVLSLWFFSFSFKRARESGMLVKFS